MASRLLRSLAAITLTFPLAAQNSAQLSSASSSATGKIVGAVVDSVNGRRLVGADIVVESTEVRSTTDSLGRFKLENLPPGTYRISVFHPLLDALGIDLITQPIRVGVDSSSYALLAVPSARTFVRRSCHNQSGPYGESAVIGHVNDPETLDPLPKVEVSIAWDEVDVSKESGIRRAPFLLRDTTNATGGFRFCGLPNSLRATLKARRGSVVTAEIPISLGDREVELGARTILLPNTTAPAKSGRAEVSGVVTLEGARSNAGTRVELLGTDIAVTTDDQGRFNLRNAPSGTGVLLARHVGFLGQSAAVDLTSREPKQLTMSLPRLVEMMDPVLVLARTTMQLDKVGFTDRKKLGVGHFLGPDDLDKKPQGYLSDILASVPGIHVRPGLYGGVISSARSGSSTCMQYFHDDQPYEELSPGDINRFIITRELVAIEVYQAEETPAPFVGPRGDCTTIVIWTRRKIHS